MLSNYKSQKSIIPFLIATIIPLFTGLGTSIANIISLIEIIILLYYFYTDIFWIMSPIYYIYYSQLLLIGDRIALFTLYSVICVLRMLYLDRELPYKMVIHFAPMLILLLYGSVVLGCSTSIWNGLILAIQSIALFYSIICIHRRNGLATIVKRVLVFMCISGAIYGVLFMNVAGVNDIQATLIQYGSRYSGTTSDPNYMAFFYCIAMVFALFDKGIHAMLKRAIVIALAIAIILTASLTALITVVCALIMYIVAAQEVKIKVKIVNVMLILAISGLFIVFIMNQSIDIPLLNLLRSRILERMEFLINGDTYMMTSGRTEYSRQYIDYLFSQNLVRVIFGGYQYNSMALVGEAIDEIRFASHNTYVDVLMTTGIIGFAVFMYIILRNIICPFKRWLITRDSNELGNIAYEIVVVIFIAGLSVFPSTSYMFFLLL